MKLDFYEPLSSDQEGAIIVTSESEIVAYWNEGAQSLFGFSSIQTLGGRVSDFVPKDQVPSVVIDLSSIFNVCYDGVVEKTQDRNLALERSAEDLREAHLHLLQLLAHSPVVIYTLRIRGNDVSPAIVSANIERFLGVTVEESADFNWWVDSLHPEDRERAMASLAQGLKEGGYTTEYRVRHKNGTYIWVEDKNRILYDEKGEPVEAVGAWTDVTERRNLQEQLLQSQKMESLGSLAGGVAHDFNNLLTGVIGYAQLAQMKLPIDSPIHSDLEQVCKSAIRAANLTKQLLTFARKEVVEPRVVNLGELVTGLDSLLRQLIGVNIEFSTMASADLGSVRVDPSQFEQVIVNLAVNGRDAMPQGGKLTINCQNVDVEEMQKMQGRAISPGSYVVLTVSDTGCGMSQEVQSRVFDPFYTTKQKGKGTGLGLSTCYGIVTNSGGYIWLYSEVGIGTTFRLFLPRIDEVPEGVKPELEIPIASHGETILVVDDEDTVRSLAAEALIRTGYNVIEAASGGAALKLVAAFPGEIHMVVTDMIMPGMTGRELADILELVKPNIRVLFISGYTDDAILHQGALTRSFSFLQKPFSIPQLMRKVREVLDRATAPVLAD